MGHRALAHRIIDGRRRYSQAGIGEALGLPQSSVSARLSGETAWKREDLIALARHLEVPLRVLVDEYMAEDEPEPVAGSGAEAAGVSR
jgi:predicted transcriptional regulator